MSYAVVIGGGSVSKNRQPADNAVSLDRLVPEKGYVKGNVVVVSWRANSLKKNATLDELKKLYDYYSKVL